MRRSELAKRVTKVKAPTWRNLWNEYQAAGHLQRMMMSMAIAAHTEVGQKELQRQKDAGEIRDWMWYGEAIENIRKLLTDE